MRPTHPGPWRPQPPLPQWLRRCCCRPRCWQPLGLPLLARPLEQGRPPGAEERAAGGWGAALAAGGEGRGSPAGAAHSPHCPGWWRLERVGCWAPAAQGGCDMWVRGRVGPGEGKGRRSRRRCLAPRGTRAAEAHAPGMRARDAHAPQQAGAAAGTGQCRQRRCGGWPPAHHIHTHRPAEPQVAWRDPELQPRLLGPGRQWACGRRRAGQAAGALL